MNGLDKAVTSRSLEAVDRTNSRLLKGEATDEPMCASLPFASRLPSATCYES
jgi:hypothetical protein